jgi:hypothetical protein
MMIPRKISPAAVLLAHFSWLSLSIVPHEVRASAGADAFAVVAELDRGRILKSADAALKCEPVTITAFRAKLSGGGPNDYYSNGENGKDEAATKNNHAVCYWLQVAVFAEFTGDKGRLDECRRRFKRDFIDVQMAPDGSFPLELKRTKPYGYSLFQLDNMATLCHVLSHPEENLWAYEGPRGRSMRQAIQFLRPYIADKTSWPYKPDVQAWEGWPTRHTSLLFASIAHQEPSYLALWQRLKPDPDLEEIRRNVALTQPLLWLKP